MESKPQYIIVREWYLEKMISLDELFKKLNSFSHESRNDLLIALNNYRTALIQGTCDCNLMDLIDRIYKLGQLQTKVETYIEKWGGSKK